MKRKYQKRIIVQLDLKLNPKIGLNHHHYQTPPHHKHFLGFLAPYEAKIWDVGSSKTRD